MWWGSETQEPIAPLTSSLASSSLGSPSCSFARAHWIRIEIVIKIWIEFGIGMFMTWSVGWAGSRQTCVVGNSGATVMCCRRGTGAYGKASHIPPMQVARVTARFPPAHRATKPPHTQSAPTSRPDQSSWNMEPAFRARASGPPGVSKERQVQRPPVYNSEDYTEYLRKYCKFTGLQVRRSNSVCQVGVFVNKIGVTCRDSQDCQDHLCHLRMSDWVWPTYQDLWAETYSYSSHVTRKGVLTIEVLHVPVACRLVTTDWDDNWQPARPLDYHTGDNWRHPKTSEDNLSQYQNISKEQ